MKWKCLQGERALGSSDVMELDITVEMIAADAELELVISLTVSADISLGSLESSSCWCGGSDDDALDLDCIVSKEPLNDSVILPLESVRKPPPIANCTHIA